MGEAEEKSPRDEAATESPGTERAAAGPTFNIGDIDSQIVNAGGEMTLSGGVNLNAAFDSATQNIQSRLEHAQKAAAQVPHGDAAQREALVELVASLRAELETASEQHQDEVLKLAKRLDALVTEVQDDEPDPEMVTITGEGLKKAAENLAGVLPTVVRIATEIVSQAGLLVR